MALRYRYLRPGVVGAILLALVLALAGAFLSGSGPTGAQADPGPELIQVGGEAFDDQGKPGSWDCTALPNIPRSPEWSVASRFGDWSPDSAGLGTSLPDGYLATVAQNTPQRYYHLVLYSPRYGDLVVDSYFSTFTQEPGTTYPTGRFDPVGRPSLVYHGGQIKIIVGLWGGGGGNRDQGGRIYTSCRITPG